MRKTEMTNDFDLTQTTIDDATIRAGMRRAHQIRGQVFAGLIKATFAALGRGLSDLRRQLGGQSAGNKVAAE
jgi:hypothetical protein